MNSMPETSRVKEWVFRVRVTAPNPAHDHWRILRSVKDYNYGRPFFITKTIHLPKGWP